MSKFFLVAFWLVASPTFADIVIGPPIFPIGGAGALGAPYAQSFTATENEPHAATVSFVWGGAFNTVNPDPTVIARLRDGVSASD